MSNCLHVIYGSLSESLAEISVLGITTQRLEHKVHPLPFLLSFVVSSGVTEIFERVLSAAERYRGGLE
jgi:hypothetical protein